MPDDTPSSQWPVLMSATTLSRYLDMSERSVWRDAATGALPAPLKLNGRTRWAKEVIDSWIAEKAAGGTRAG